MPDRRHRVYTVLIAGVAFLMLASYVVPDRFQGIWTGVVWAAMAIAMLGIGFTVGEDRMRRQAIQRGGVEVEAEVLRRYDAGMPSGEGIPKGPQPLRSAEDPLELELRYTFGDREIVSRGRVSTKTYFHARGMKTLKVKVSPERPEEWVEVA
jgi:hypothetical protein